MFYVLLDEGNKAHAFVCEKPSEEMKFLEMETEEKALNVLGKIWTGQEFIKSLTEQEQENLNMKVSTEYLICLQEINVGI